MQLYKVTHKENNQQWIWTPKKLLKVVNSNGSDDWTNYNTQDLKNNYKEVCYWLHELDIQPI
jgi:hypothetical protein